MLKGAIKKITASNRYELTKEERELGIKIFAILGILLNLVLFCGKSIVGLLVGSVAIYSDAFNNLSDAGSSLITFIGVKLSAKKADSEHPFGHGRMEYLSALAVSVLIIVMGFELAKESIAKIISPDVLQNDFFWPTIIVLLVSVFIKVYMWFYNRKYGKPLKSNSMIATATDSLSDAMATFAVILSTFIARFTGFYRMDGICGFLVSLFIFYAGCRAVKETLVPLLGQPPEQELIQNIEKIVMEQPDIIGIHDVVVHDYGPGRLMISLHAEVPHDSQLSVVHDMIDNAEAELRDRLNCNAVIHCDPIDTKDPITLRLKSDILTIVNEISPNVSMHDFRVVHGKTHTNIIFDLLIPNSFELEDDELCKMVRGEVLKIHPNHFCYIQIDHDFTK